MSEQNTTDPFEGLNSEPQETVIAAVPPAPLPTTIDPPTPKKIWTRDRTVRSVEVGVALPTLYPDYEPWTFNLKLQLSVDAEERRQEYLSLSPSEQTIKLKEQALDEICDLLVSIPTGFGDIKDTGRGPGESFREYVNTADAEAKTMLLTIVEGADTLYWRAISPREFRRSV